MLGSLLAIPIVVYVITYIPWAFVEGHQIIKGWPPGHTGQTLLDLTGAMYRYHNDLTAPHPASSPWWAWPLNLKPVWFYQGSFAELDRRLDLRRRQRDPVVDGHPGDGVRRRPGVPAATRCPSR